MTKRNRLKFLSQALALAALSEKCHQYIPLQGLTSGVRIPSLHGDRELNLFQRTGMWANTPPFATRLFILTFTFTHCFVPASTLRHGYRYTDATRTQQWTWELSLRQYNWMLRVYGAT